MIIVDMLSNKEILEDYTLKTLIRYNHRNRIVNESVAEHSFFVSLFCLKILKQLNLSKDLERSILINSILHDVPEIETSDIPHDIKEKFPEINNSLVVIEEEYYKKHWEKYLKEMNSKNKLVYNIIKLADAYSVKQYCLSENQLGNKSESIKNILEDVEKRIIKHLKEINKLKGEYENAKK